jgi:asparagine synthase (glutamine-hydrolysing)
MTTGAKPGVNEALPLQGGLGVVLGKVFRHGASPDTATRRTSLSAAEVVEILNTGGTSLVNNFWGRYVAFFQTASGSPCVLRDPSGTLPCYRLQVDGVSVIFSWLEDARQLLEEDAHADVNWDALHFLLLGGSLTGPFTALAGVHRLMPGERFDLLGQTSKLLWRAMDMARSPLACTASDAAQRLRDTVQSSAAAWASCYDSLMVRLSGGVDSSILFSCLSTARTTADVIGLNYHSAGSDSDERRYARLTAAKVGRDVIERERDAGFQVSSLRCIARMTEPVRYLGWMNSATDTQLAAAYRAPAMFTGAGGDSVFYEFARWWPAADYLCAKGLDAGFPAAALDAARLARMSVWRVIALACKERIGAHAAQRRPGGHVPLLAAELRENCEDRSRFAHPDLREAGDVPLGKYMQTSALMFPLTYYNPFDRSAAPEIVNPLLSQPLVELCLRLPTYLLTQGGHGRALVRRAFAEDLPAQIIHRRSKGGLEEHVKAVLASNIETIRPMLLDGELARRGLLDRPRLEAQLSGRPTALAAPLSHIHALVATEAWLRQALD